MLGFLSMLLRVLIDCCRFRQDLVLENLVLRHQLEVLLRRKPKPRLRNRDRILLVLSGSPLTGPDFVRVLARVRVQLEEIDAG